VKSMPCPKVNTKTRYDMYDVQYPEFRLPPRNITPHKISPHYISLLSCNVLDEEEKAIAAESALNYISASEPLSDDTTNWSSTDQDDPFQPLQQCKLKKTPQTCSQSAEWKYPHYAGCDCGDDYHAW
jgi:hypothetical protein